MSALVPFSVPVENTIYTIDALPALAAVLLGIVSVGVCVSSLRKEAGTAGALLLTLGALLTAMIGSALWLGASASASLPFLFGAKGWDYVARIFFVPLLVEHAAMILAGAATIVSIRTIVGTAQEDRKKLRLPILGIALTPLALLILLHALAVEKLLLLPRGALAGPPHIHVGQRRPAAPYLTYSDGSKYDQQEYEVSASLSSIIGDTPGPRELVVQALGTHVSFESRVVVQVAENRAGGPFPLRNGDEVHYAGPRNCLYEDGKSDSKNFAVSFRITDAGERDGLSIFQVEFSRGESFFAYSADGDSYWLPDKSAKDKRIQPIVSWNRSAGDGCQFAPFEAKATCRANPDRIETLSLMGGTNGAGQVVAGILTLGIYVPERSKCTMELTRTSSAARPQ